ncbi:MAG: saccharopine dehydrogenase NADP-binding domain-containing protein [Myxococcaceae bacterium]
MNDEIWVLGATGRTGTAIAKNLAARGLKVGLVGRNAGKLELLAKAVPGARAIVAGTTAEMCDAITREAPKVVMNTIGPFTETAVPIARALPKGSHYVDLSNELKGIVDVLALDEEARAAGKCLVPGAGYGFVSTESVVRALCEGMPPAEKVRVDAIPFIGESEGSDRIGEALAASILDSLAYGGWEYSGGALVRASLGGHPTRLKLPDGDERSTGSTPLGDLVGAQRASGAAQVVAGSGEMPAGAVARAMLPVVGALLSWRPMRNFAVRQMAKLKAPPPKKKEGFSWGHARVEWADGRVKEGWFRTGDGMGFTCASAAEVCARLCSGAPKVGAFTAGDLWGAELARSLGAEIRIA